MKAKFLLATAMAATVLGADAGNLWLVGDAAPYGWSLDDATALLSTEAAPDVYSGTLYLKSDAEFKFLETTDWGGPEYGAAEGATLTDGKIALTKGMNDEGYGKIKVAESANYLITVNTSTLEATIVKSEYQTSEIDVCSLYMVGSATPNGWSVPDGTPMYQNPARPYVFEAKDVTLTEGSFKIATAMKGASSWDPKYWYFRDASDDNTIALGQDGDLQWEIAEAGSYDVTVDLESKTINIAKSNTSIAVTVTDDRNAGVEYFTLSGIRTGRPGHGVYIERRGDSTRKVVIR